MNTFVLLPLRGRTSWPLRLAIFCALVWLFPLGAHATKLTTTIPASLITSAGTASITVTTPHVGTSGSKTLTINP